MDLFLLLIIGGIATWRISSIVVNENMPFRLLDKLRERVGIYNLERMSYDEKSEFIIDNPDAHYYANDTLAIVESTWINELFSCVGCVSVWIGFFISFLFLISGLLNFISFLVFAFAFSAIAIFLEILRTKFLT